MRIQHTRAALSRRRLLSGAMAAGAGAFVIACGGGSKDEGSTTTGAAATAAGAATTVAETPKPGGVLREADITQAPHFSPFHPGADPSFVNYWRRFNGYYEALWAFKAVDGPDRMALRLAQSVEQPDETTYVVKLHPSTFHNRPPVNGRKVTAEDVAATIEFLRKPPASGGSFIQSGKDLKSVTVVDELTLRFQTHGPRAFFYQDGVGVASGGRIVAPKEMLDEETLKRTPPIGSGPYEYKSHTQGSIEEVKRYEGYRLKPRPWIDEKKLTFVPDSAAIEAAFRSGQIDRITFTDIKQRDSVAKDLGSRIKTETYPSESGMALIVNINRAPWNDVRVREALHRAIDVDRVINVVFFGDGQRTWYFSQANTDNSPISFDQVKQYVGYDPKKATELLKASGMDLSKEYEFMVPVETQTWVDSARLMAEDFQKVGLKTRINPVVRNIYLQRAGPKPGDFDISMSVLLEYRHAKTDSGTFWNSTSLQDPEVDAIIEKIEQTVDAKARDKLAQDFQIMLARKYSNFIPVRSGSVHNGWYAHLKGFNEEYRKFNGNYSWQDDRWLDRT